MRWISLVLGLTQAKRVKLTLSRNFIKNPIESPAIQRINHGVKNRRRWRKIRINGTLGASLSPLGWRRTPSLEWLVKW